MADTLLAFLRTKFFPERSEEVATEALAYCLNTSDRVRGAFTDYMRTFQPVLSPFDRVFTQAGAATDSAYPDVASVPTDGSAPDLLLELKFDAGLTPNQPTTYLTRLLGLGRPGLLLFVVPDRRRDHVWETVVMHAQRAYELSADHRPRCKSVLNVDHDARLALVTWKELLEAVNISDDPQGAASIDQLRGLCEFEDRVAFRPFEARDLESRVAERILDVLHLLWEAGETQLPALGRVDNRHLYRTAGADGWFGRYMLVEGWECLFHINLRRWATLRDTPLWLRITDKRAHTYPPLLEALRPLTATGRFLNNDGQRRIPISIPVGEDRDTTLDAIVAQVVEVADLLKLCPPPVKRPAAEAPAVDVQSEA